MLKFFSPVRRNAVNHLLYGIAHTRWATHGKPTVANAHPHFSGRVGVVHNGIIENYEELRASFNGARNFESDTDTEVVAHIMDAALSDGMSPEDAFAHTLSKLRGAFALGIIVEGEPGRRRPRYCHRDRRANL